ncbi:MAG: hypothetical protein ACI868_000530 [Granulosicoccus sp.]|jgi:hypothetical protein
MSCFGLNSADWRVTKAARPAFQTIVLNIRSALRLVKLAHKYHAVSKEFSP